MVGGCRCGGFKAACVSHSFFLCQCGLHGMQQAAALCLLPMSLFTACCLCPPSCMRRVTELRVANTATMFLPFHQCPGGAGGMQQVKLQLPPWRLCDM